MYNFLVQAYATYKGLFYWLNWISYITNIFLHPVIFVLTYSILGRFALGEEAARYYGIGILMNQMTFILISGITQAFTYDRELGTIAFMYISPANRLVNFLSRAVYHYPNALLVFATGLTALWLLIGLDFGSMNWGSFIIAVLVTAASIAAFSEFLSTFTIVFRDWLNAMALAVGILFAFTGVIIPIDIYPQAVQEFARLLPVTNGLEVIRSSFTGVPLADMSWGIIREALTGVAYFIIGYIGFVVFEQVVKRTGTLEIEALS